MRVGADDDVRAPVRQLLRQLPLSGGGGGAVLLPPVHRDDGDVRYLRGLFHLLLHPFGLVGVGDLLLLTLRQRDAVGVLGEARKGKLMPSRSSTGTAPSVPVMAGMLFSRSACSVSVSPSVP